MFMFPHLHNKKITYTSMNYIYVQKKTGQETIPACPFIYDYYAIFQATTRL
ncbi:hypothetical protein SAM19_05199 [Brevibacillus laterosporus]|nr:hypothetical protein [Brevibacillus laterosporus]